MEKTQKLIKKLMKLEMTKEGMEEKRIKKKRREEKIRKIGYKKYIMSSLRLT